uniref:Xylose isomerase domain protein TIM barrel n=1 Tax=Caulobacter sp. (strain K31) TaxID=366602 RepID=B0T5L0_CAUSK
MVRRQLLGGLAIPVGAALLGLSSRRALAQGPAAGPPTLPPPPKQWPIKPSAPPLKLKGPYKQGLTRMVLGPELSTEACCQVAVSLGAKGLDFFSDPKDWPILKKYGLVCSMYRPDFGGGSSAWRPPFGPPGWGAIGMTQAQGDYLAEFHKAIDLAADNGLPNVILLAGTRHTVNYEQGAQNAVAFCNQVKAHAEQRGVTLCMELINSHGVGGPPLSLFDHAKWGFDVVKQVGSPRVKVLYDVFHAQMMDGNLIKTITDNFDLIGHFHTGGVPGRHEIDDSQEINYRLVAKTIASLGYTGFVTHEWTPSPGSDALTVLRRSMEIMDA